MIRVRRLRRAQSSRAEFGVQSWSILFALSAIFLAAIMLFPGCGSMHGPSLVQSQTKDGNVVLELPSTATGAREDLPAGVEADDVAAIINLAVEDEDGAAANPAAEKKPGFFSRLTGKAKKAKPRPSSNKLTVTKDGRVFAGDQALKQVESVETPKDPWYLWPLRILAGLMVGVLVGSLLYLRGLLAPLLEPLKRFKLFERFKR